MAELLSLLRKDGSGVALGVVVALVAMAASALLLPHGERRRARPALFLLLASLACDVPAMLLAPKTGARNVLQFVAAFLLLASIARSVIVVALDVVVERRRSQPVPKIFRDLSHGVAYFAVALIALRAAGVEPGSILTTSALLTAVVGLALQDTIGNLVSGLALQMQKPFEVGDWIRYNDGAGQVGRVTEVTWRATTVMTTSQVEVVVPNGVLAKASIQNFTKPSTISRRFVAVSAPYDVPPHRVHEALLAAAATVEGVRLEPAPSVVTKNFGDSGVEYHLRFFIDDFEAHEAIDGRVRDRVWYALQRAGITIPFPIRTVQLHPHGPAAQLRSREAETDARVAALARVELLSALSGDELRALARAAHSLHFGHGERVVVAGQAGSELFAIVEGTVVVELPHPEGTMKLARLGVGESFGEMSLLTGEPRNATVRAFGACELLAIRDDDLRPILAARPELATKLSDVLAERQEAIDFARQASRKGQEPPADRKRRLVSQIRSFFKIE